MSPFRGSERLVYEETSLIHGRAIAFFNVIFSGSINAPVSLTYPSLDTLNAKLVTS
jgi:hypothetical protein